MQPFVAAEKVKDAYWRYIETSFPIRREALRRQFRRLVEEQRLKCYFELMEILTVP
jgi:hypothetical protein